MMIRRAMMAAMMCLFGLTGMLRAQTQQPANLVENGGFEKSLAGWHWEEWKGYKVPGFVDRDDVNEGAASFKLTAPGVEGSRQMGMPVKGVQAGKDYTLKIDLSTKDVPEKSCVVRILQFAKDAEGKSKPSGWIQVPAGSGVNELIKIGGTTDWKTYTVKISAKAIVENIANVWIMIDHKQPGQGIIGIDNVRLTEGIEEDIKPQAMAPVQSQHESSIAMTYDIADPTVLVPVKTKGLGFQLEPEQSLYRTAHLPRVTLNAPAMANATLSLQIKDGFGNIIHSSKPTAMDQAVQIPVTLPVDQGYLELISQVSRDGQTVAQSRRALGILSPPAAISTSEPWGLWCNGSEDFEELGVRWTRPALYWYFFNKDGQDYIDQTIRMIDQKHAQGIKVLMYPKDHPSQFAVTQKVFKDTPEAWASVRAYWTALVKGLKGKVDAWGLINEPYRGMWAGTDDLIVRYWAMMHDIVKEYDPDTPVIGPSLNINEPSMMAQYSELLEMGLGKHIDGLELHTYTATAMPEDINWENNITQVRKLTEKAAGDMPIYSTEMGMSMGYDSELYQAQYLARCFAWAKRMDLKMLLWHMYSWPQGSPLSERDFAIFRSDPRKVESSQPRPAGVAYGVMTRQLSGTTYRTELDYLGPSVKAFVFERDGDAMIAIWRVDTRESNVDLAVSQSQPTVTNLFGSTKTLPVKDGIITLTIGPSVQFVHGIGKDYLQSKPLIQTPATLAMQAGSAGRAQLLITNPTDQPATLTLHWLTADRWQVDSGDQPLSLKPHQTQTLDVTVRTPADSSYGQTVIYARAKLNGKLVTPARLPVLVQPRIQIVQVRPAMAMQTYKPQIDLELHRLDPSLQQINVQVGSTSQQATITQDRFTLSLPAQLDQASTRLHDFAITLSDGSRLQDQQSQALSFVPTLLMSQRPQIDGDLSDWPAMPTPTMDAPAVAWRWDADHLYLAVKAIDPMHVQNQRPETLWSQDSIQIGISAFDPQDYLRKPIGEMRESDHIELAVGAGQSGPALAYCHATSNRQTCPMGEVTSSMMPATVTINQGVTSYELAIPAQLIGLKPLAAGKIVRASVLLNCRDDGRRSYIEWFSGIAQTKSPNLYGHLILLSGE